MLTSKIKNDIIDALKKDGFNVIDRKQFVVATKKENILYIRGLEDIQTQLNFQYLTQQSNLKRIGGVAVIEVRKLLTEALNKKIQDVIPFVCNKLNWAVTQKDSFMVGDTQIDSVELITDKDEIVSMVFYDKEKPEQFFALEMGHRELLKLIDSIQYKGLKTLAPNFYELIESN